jgi:hypothetical protein
MGNRCQRVSPDRCGDGRRLVLAETAAPPLRGYIIVGRVSMKRLAVRSAAMALLSSTGDVGGW